MILLRGSEAVAGIQAVIHKGLSEKVESHSCLWIENQAQEGWKVAKNQLKRPVSLVKNEYQNIGSLVAGLNSGSERLIHSLMNNAGLRFLTYIQNRERDFKSLLFWLKWKDGRCSKKGEL